MFHSQSDRRPTVNRPSCCLRTHAIASSNWAA